MQNVLTVIGVALLVLFIALIFGGGMMGFGGGQMGSGIMGGMMGGYGLNANPLGWIGMIALWAFVIGGIAMAAVWVARNAGKRAPAGESPLEILKARYARGEITTEQYAEMKKMLLTA